MARKWQTHKEHPRGLMVIAAFKILKGLALLAVALGALKLMHRDVAADFEHLVNLFRVDPHNHYIHLVLEKLAGVNAAKLKELSLGTFFYSAIFFTEGIGLALRKRWAEYMTIVTTASFLPLEVYEIIKHTTLGRVLMLLFNLAIVIYLVRELRRNPKHSGRAKP
jgi:uncharacterized membrane protein (DUF2068 family)